MEIISSTKIQKAYTEYETPCFGTVQEERMLHIVLTQIFTLNFPNIPKIVYREL